MTRKRLLGGALVCALMAACSNAPQTPSSPGGITPTTAALNPDGSSLKVTAPNGLLPNGGVTDSRRPTLVFNPSTGVYTPVSNLVYEIEVLNAANTVVYQRDSVSGTSHGLEADLNYADNYSWRLRARLGNDVGPWSGFAGFRTLDPPAPPPPPTPSAGQLPFPIPAACAAPGDGDRFACAASIAALSVEWAGCAAGSGTRCHRFTRQVVYALSQSDPNWKMIQAAPGGHACNCSSCGPSDGTMFREDTTVSAGRNVYDMIIGAGGPTPSLNWSFVGAPRNVDGPGDAPLCVP
jgi:hypothetical protein